MINVSGYSLILCVPCDRLLADSLLRELNRLPSIRSPSELHCCQDGSVHSEERSSESIQLPLDFDLVIVLATPASIGSERFNKCVEFALRKDKPVVILRSSTTEIPCRWIPMRTITLSTGNFRQVATEIDAMSPRRRQEDFEMLVSTGAGIGEFENLVMSCIESLPCEYLMRPSYFFKPIADSSECNCSCIAIRSDALGMHAALYYFETPYQSGDERDAERLAIRMSADIDLLRKPIRSSHSLHPARLLSHPEELGDAATSFARSHLSMETDDVPYAHVDCHAIIGRSVGPHTVDQDKLSVRIGKFLGKLVESPPIWDEPEVHVSTYDSIFVGAAS